MNNRGDWPSGYGLDPYYKDLSVLDLLITKWDISSSTIQMVASASSQEVWKWTQGVHEIPPRQLQKLSQFLNYLETQKTS